jgi:transposase InsO family protein
MERHDMAHVRGAPYHPMTQGKIERWHQTLKNRILLENYYLPGDLEAQIEAFVADYNHCRYHDTLTPADVYFGRPLGNANHFFSVAGIRGGMPLGDSREPRESSWPSPNGGFVPSR